MDQTQLTVSLQTSINIFMRSESQFVLTKEKLRILKSISSKEKLITNDHLACQLFIYLITPGYLR